LEIFEEFFHYRFRRRGLRKLVLPKLGISENWKEKVSKKTYPLPLDGLDQRNMLFGISRM
jgi:hypothetical protein